MCFLLCSLCVYVRMVLANLTVQSGGQCLLSVYVSCVSCVCLLCVFYVHVCV